MHIPFSFSFFRFIPVPAITSALTIQAESPHDRFYFYTLWPKHMLGYLTTAAISIYYLLSFLVNSTLTIITLGAPYLHYTLYRHDENETDSSEKYPQMLKALDTLWDQWSNFLLHILPILFPMVSSSGVPLCSFAGFAASMTFTIGVVSVATRIIFKVKAKELENDHAINEWRQASERSWRKVPNKSFWILFSLPTVFFFLSVCLLISTVMLTFWERPVAGVTPSLETPGCTLKRLQTFKYTLLTMLVATVAHFTFVIVKLHFLTAFQSAEFASAA